MYQSQFVFEELVTNHPIIWEDPSDTLLRLCKDVGCIQSGHHELTDLIEDHDMWMWDQCMNYKCENCLYWGFPCDNLAHYCLNVPHLSRQWDPQFPA